MPSHEFWSTLPEIGVLAEIAQRERLTFALRGSAAQMLADAYAKNETLESLFAAMPPLSDVDFVVDDKARAYALAAALAREFPASRYFRVDIRTEAELKHYQDAPVLVTGQPEIRFGGGASPAPYEAVVRLRNGEKFQAEVGSGFLKEPVIERIKTEIEPQECLTNLIWIGRRCPYGTDVCEDFSGKLAEASPRRVAEQLHGKPLRKLLFDLVKLLLKLVATDEKPDWLDHEFLNRLADEKDHPQLKRLVQLLREPPQAVMAVVVPRRDRSQWRSQVETVEALSPDTDDLKLDGALHVSRRGPPARIITDDPERPGCCRYRDFSRGVAEVAWTGPPAPRSERFTLVTVDGEFVFAPSWATSRDKQHEVRVDYGFLCQMRGGRGPAEVHYGGVDHVDEVPDGE